jgi:hypothetical protein
MDFFVYSGVVRSIVTALAQCRRDSAANADDTIGF